MIMAGAVINPESVIGDNVIINTSASVDHHNRIDRDAHLSPGAHTGGRVQIGRGAHVGLGAVVLPKLQVGEWAVVGAGAVVERNIPSRVVAVGVPARPIRNLGSAPRGALHSLRRPDGGSVAGMDV
jgi:acetyltransferase-like isoleucine patch superfamily enzyme